MKYFILGLCLLSSNAYSMVECNPKNPSLLIETQKYFDLEVKKHEQGLSEASQLARATGLMAQVLLCYGKISDKEFCKGGKFNAPKALTVVREEYKKGLEVGYFIQKDLVEAEKDLHKVEAYCVKKGLL